VQGGILLLFLDLHDAANEPQRIVEFACSYGTLKESEPVFDFRWNPFVLLDWAAKFGTSPYPPHRESIRDWVRLAQGYRLVLYAAGKLNMMRSVAAECRSRAPAPSPCHLSVPALPDRSIFRTAPGRTTLLDRIIPGCTPRVHSGSLARTQPAVLCLYEAAHAQSRA